MAASVNKGILSVSAERTIVASADVVYRCLADYRRHHPHILPPAFSDFMVEEGGVGAGTIIHFRVRAGGRTRTFHQRVEEPEPGRVLLERGIESDESTRFTVTPAATGCQVQIDTSFPVAEGLRGLIERLFAPRILRPMYQDELRRLERYAQALGTEGEG